MSQLKLQSIEAGYGSVRALQGISLSVEQGTMVALLGANGAGKSTVFHLISGNLTPTSGEIVFNGRSIQGLATQEINRHGLARCFQITKIFPKLTVFENLRLAVMRRHGLHYTFWRMLSKVPLVGHETDQLLERVRLKARAKTLAGELSYSEQRAL